MFRKEIFNSLGRLMHDEAFLISTEHNQYDEFEQ